METYFNKRHTWIALVLGAWSWQAAAVPNGERPPEIKCSESCRSLGYVIEVTETPQHGSVVTFLPTSVSDIYTAQTIAARFGTQALNNPPPGVVFSLIKKGVRPSDRICNNRGERIAQGNAYRVREPNPHHWEHETLEVAGWEEVCGGDLSDWYFSATRLNQRRPLPICAETAECPEDVEPGVSGGAQWGGRPSHVGADSEVVAGDWNLIPDTPKLVPVPGSTAPATTGGATWTAWLNRDTPGGSGDFETLRHFVEAGEACAAPLRIECRVRNGRGWREAGQSYSCEPDRGGVCRNADQRGQRCLDYEVRFLCSR